MADIHDARKSPSVLPWVIGVGLVLLAVFWLSWDSDTDTLPVAESGVAGTPGADERPGTGTSRQSVPTEVAAYRSFVQSSATAPGPSHDYAATGVRRLSEALRAVAATVGATNEPIAQGLTKFEEGADRLQADPKSLDHADIVKNLFVDAVTAMTSIQEARSSGSIALKNRVDDLRRLAESIEVNRPLLDQQQRLTQFFDQSAETLAMLAQQESQL